MSYILKNKDEVHRLKKQSESKLYHVADEVSHIDIFDGANVLEVGCGAGDLISHLDNKFEINSMGIDLLEEHIEFCKGKYPQINFRQHNIVESPLEHKFDFIFMRLVGHHLGIDRLSKAVQNIYHMLSKGGSICLIDVDGFMFNLYGIDEKLDQYFAQIEKKFDGDLLIGRKLPRLLHNQNFFNIEYRVQICDFQKEDRAEEVNQWDNRLKFAQEDFINIFGEKIDYMRFKNLFMETIRNENIPLFFNKFIVEGKK